MVTDPATTPSEPQAQMLFGAAVAFTYSLLMVMHIVFGLFFALTIVCTLRGIGLWAHGLSHQRKPSVGALAVSAVVHSRVDSGGLQHQEGQATGVTVAGGRES